MKKIWILQTGEPLQIDKGSPRPMRAMNLSNKLVEKGYQVVLWSSAFHHQSKTHRAKTYQEYQVSPSLTIRLIPSCGYKKNISLMRFIDHIQLALHLKKQLKTILEKPDVIVVGYPPIEVASVMINWATKHNIPTVLDVKDLWPQIYVDAFPDFLKPFAKILFLPYFHLAKKAIKNATSVTSMANRFLETVQSFANREKCSNDKVFPLTPFIYSDINQKNHHEVQDWWEALSIKPENPVLFFAGSLETAFDFDLVADALDILYAESINFTLLLCGHGSQLRHVKNKMSRFSSVVFPGWLDIYQLEFVAAKSIASLAPYKNIENYIANTPNKIIDSLRLGVPILCPLSGEVETLITEHKVGIKYSDAESLARAMKEIIHNPESQKEMSKNCLQLYEERFEYHKVYGSFMKHIEDLST